MQKDTTLLLSSRFYAYVQDADPWGLPNHLWSDAPHLLVFFDRFICDEKALSAEERSATELGWVMSGLFLKLRQEGILVTTNTARIVKKAPAPPGGIRLPRLEAHYAAYVQTQLGLPMFDWEGRIAKRLGTLAPSVSSADARTPRAMLKLAYLWRIIAAPAQIVPSLDDLGGDSRDAYRAVLKLQEPYWRSLERGEMDVDEYIGNIARFMPYYRRIDGLLRPIARRNFDRFLRMRDKTESERKQIATLILEAFDDTKELATFAAVVQTELAKKIPSLFGALAAGTGKLLIGMAALSLPAIAWSTGHSYGGGEALGVPHGAKAIMSGMRTLAGRRADIRAANPLRFMVATARKGGLGRAGA